MKNICKDSKDLLLLQRIRIAGNAEERPANVVQRVRQNVGAVAGNGHRFSQEKQLFYKL